MAANETTALLGSDIPASRKHSCCKRTSFGVEVVIILTALYGTPNLLIEEQYIYNFLQREYNFSNDTSKYLRNGVNFSYTEFQQDVQARSSQIMLILTVTTSVLSMFVCLFLGSYSDAKGRKLIMVVSLLGSTIKSSILMLVAVLGVSYWYLLIGHVIDGLCGSYAALVTMCFAYGADVSNKDKRSLKVTILEVCLGLSAAAGTYSTGFIIQAVGYAFSFSITVALNVLNLFYTIVILPISTHEEDPNGKQSIYNHFVSCFKLYFKDNKTNRRWKLQYNLIMLFTLSLVFTSKTDSQTYFLKGEPLKLDETEVGVFTGTMILVHYFGCILAVMFLGPKIGDFWLIVMGCISGTLQFAMLAFTSVLWMLITSK